MEKNVVSDKTIERLRSLIDERLDLQTSINYCNDKIDKIDVEINTLCAEIAKCENNE